jgi:hypothetical protein
MLWLIEKQWPQEPTERVSDNVEQIHTWKCPFLSSICLSPGTSLTWETELYDSRKSACIASTWYHRIFIQKKKHQKRLLFCFIHFSSQKPFADTEGVSQVVDYLLCKYEVLGLNLSPIKKKKKEEEKSHLQAGRLTQVVEHLPSKYMVLSSNLVLPTKNTCNYEIF